MVVKGPAASDYSAMAYLPEPSSSCVVPLDVVW